MAADTGLESIRARVANKLMEIEGVSGVGSGTDRIHVYLANDDDLTRAAVGRVMNGEASGTPFELIVSGAFSARPPLGKT